jgi:hypothetical protein
MTDIEKKFDETLEIEAIGQEEREKRIEGIFEKCLGVVVIVGFLALLSRAADNGTLVPTLIFVGVLALVGYILYRIDPDAY